MGADAFKDPCVAADLEAIPEALNEDATMRVLPSYYAESGGVDGFFAARFKVA